MGEVYRARSDVGSQVSHFPMISAFDINGALTRKRPDLPAPDPLYTDTAYVQYDNAGNGIRSGAVFQRSTTSGDRYYTAVRNYYSADNKLVAVQKYHATDAGRTGAWEEFRYDALGRRVLSRSRRGDNGNPLAALCSGAMAACDGYVERTVWDGNQILYELRADGGDSRTALQLDQLTSGGPLWGKAGYVHAGGIDKPLVTMDGRVPTYNWRGLPESSVWTDGTKADCSLVYSGCVLIAWPSANSIYLRPPPGGGGGATPQWVGTVLQDGAGSTGMLYRRNRFYDPTTGQFTQQDPIGIAGGANVYGFADGDPVNNSDPFGLSSDCRVVKCPDPSIVISNAEVQRRADEMYAETLKDGKERGAVLFNGKDGGIEVGPTIIGTARDANGTAAVPGLAKLPRNAIGSLHTHPLPRPGKNDPVGPSGGDVWHAQLNNAMPVVRDVGAIYILNMNGSAAFMIRRSP